MYYKYHNVLPVTLASLFIILASSQAAQPVTEIPLAQEAQSTTLTWDPAPSKAVVGYKIHYGTSRGTYTNTVDVGNVNTARITNLLAGANYFFVVTAYNQARVESLPSNEETISIAPLISAMEQLDDGTFQLTLNGAAGGTHVVYVSNDLRDWTLLARAVNTTGTLVVNDDEAAKADTRFYQVSTE